MARGAGGTLVVGLGNDDRGDDGVGPLVARLLACRLVDEPPLRAEVWPWTGDPMALLDLWEGWDRLIVIDAMVSGQEPGRCQRFEGTVPFQTHAGASTHGLGLAAVLALGRALGRTPGVVEVWGVEGRAFTPGAPLTPAVAHAALALVDRLRRDLTGCGPLDASSGA